LRPLHRTTRGALHDRNTTVWNRRRAASADELIIDIRSDAFRCPVDDQPFAAGNLERPFEPFGKASVGSNALTPGLRYSNGWAAIAARILRLIGWLNRRKPIGERRVSLMKTQPSALRSPSPLPKARGFLSAGRRLNTSHPARRVSAGPKLRAICCPALAPTEISLSVNKINVLTAKLSPRATPSQALPSPSLFPKLWKITGPCSDGGTKIGNPDLNERFSCVEFETMSDQELAVQAIREAQQILEEYLEPRHHDNEKLLDRLVEVLERPSVLVAIDRLRRVNRR
jgi:hypothetical protein